MLIYEYVCIYGDIYDIHCWVTYMYTYWSRYIPSEYTKQFILKKNSEKIQSEGIYMYIGT